MKRIQRITMAMVFVVFGMAVGQLTDWPPAALGEVRSGPPPQAFQSGGQLSVPILRDISATLQQMDARLARLELMGKKMQTSRGARVE